MMKHGTVSILCSVPEPKRPDCLPARRRIPDACLPENFPEEYENFATRSDMWGNWRLVADFSESKLQGDIRGIRVRRPGEDYYRYLPYTTYFSISNGEIVDGRFTASVSGVDLAENAPPDTDTVRGFSGSILGEFYGPEAEEAGGVLRASRASDSRVLVGSFGAVQVPELDVTIPMGDLGPRPPLSVAVDRDIVTETVQAATATEVTAIESDGANGFRVTYTVDGVDQRIHLEDDDYQTDSCGLLCICCAHSRRVLRTRGPNRRIRWHSRVRLLQRSRMVGGLR